ncbi:S9 family peptidase, partial [bacterium]|nr:S9 family peptidase [bacterium]
GAQHLYHVSPRNLEFERIIAGRREIQTYAPAVKQNKIYFTASDPMHSSDLFVCDLNGANERQLTFLNDSLLQRRDLVQPQEVFYTSPDGTPIHGWVMPPLAARPGEKQPLVVQIHGGPYWHFGWRWEYDFQQLIGRGFGVFFCNPRISTSYGQAFAEKDQGKWAEGDLQDVLAGIDYVTQNFSWADSTRIGVTGGSYGGYLTNMLLVRTNRFKAGVAQRSITNLFSYYATTDVQNFIEFEFGWPLRKDELLQRSPVWLAEQIKTPLLLIHSENDYRVPVSQAEELYVHLKRRGQIVQLVRYPNEGHELSRSGQPLHRVDRMNRIADWFEIYLK